VEACEVVDVDRANSTGRLGSIWGNIRDHGLLTTGREDLKLQKSLVNGIRAGL